MKTNIISNGSKWGGEAPDSIEKLLEMLSIHTIEERFFIAYNTKGSWRAGKDDANLCPVYIIDGVYKFLGNFEEYSHVFQVTTDDPEVGKKLATAIKNNTGWKLYYERNLVNDTKRT